MHNLTCHECRTLLVGYINGELTQKRRWRVGQHLNECAACYARYVEQRNLAHDLRTDLNLIGQPSRPQLSHIWSSIQSDMRRAQPFQPRFRRRYGIAVLVLVLSLLLPWSLGGDAFVLAVPLPAVPASLAGSAPVTGTPALKQTVALLLTDARIPPAETPSAPPTIP
jgi:anti-sigma factor RsiW